jgi:hypothetical protein
MRIKMTTIRSRKRAVALLLFLVPAALRGQNVSPNGDPSPPSQPVSSLDLHLKVQLDSKLKLSALHPGELVEGTLSRSVYSRDRELFPAGSRIRLTVASLEKRRRVPNDHWPWVIKAFTPRHEKYPVFKTAQVFLPDGGQIPLSVELVSIARAVAVHAAKQKRSASTNHSEPAATDSSAQRDSAPSRENANPHLIAASNFIATFQAALISADGQPQAQTLKADSNVQRSDSAGEVLNVTAGTQARLILLDGISASGGRPGDSFRARLVEPIYSGASLVLPEGLLFEGKIVKRTPPRMLSRSASLLLSFTAMTSSSGATHPISASLAAIELDQRSHTRVDPEGELRGEHPGKAWMVLNLAATGGIAKVTDDTLQLVIEALVSSATDVSTAGSGRIAAACISGLFMLTRHGRDVVLPKFTEMEIVFDRPATIPASQAASSHAQAPRELTAVK